MSVKHFANVLVANGSPDAQAITFKLHFPHGDYWSMTDESGTVADLVLHSKQEVVETARDFLSKAVTGSLDTSVDDIVVSEFEGSVCSKSYPYLALLVDRILDFGTAPQAVALGYRMRGTVDGTCAQVVKMFAHEDVILVKGPSFFGSPDTFEFGVFRNFTSHFKAAH